MKKKLILPLSGLILLTTSFLIISCNQHTDEGKLKIGVILSLSGNGSASGDYTLKGIELAVKEQNEKGGLLNRQIELDIHDSKGDPDTGANEIRHMLGEKIAPFMVCSNTSGVSLNVKAETEKRKILLVASAATDRLLVNSQYTVRNFIASDQISDEILKYLNDSLLLRSVGIFYANNEFGKSVSRKIVEKAEFYNTNLPFNIAYDDKNTDYKALIAGYNGKQAPAIYVAGLGNSLGVFIKQLRESGYQGIIIADPLFNNADIKNAAGTAAKGVEFFDFAFHKASDNPATKTFVNDYSKSFNSEPENLAAITYDAVKMLFAAMEKAKSLDYKKAKKFIDNRKYSGVTGEIWLKEGNIIYPTTFKMH